MKRGNLIALVHPDWVFYLPFLFFLWKKICVRVCVGGGG